MDTFPAIPHLIPLLTVAPSAVVPARADEELPPFGDAAAVRTWTNPVPPASLADWLAGVLDRAAAWLNHRAEDLRSASGTQPASA